MFDFQNPDAVRSYDQDAQAPRFDRSTFRGACPFAGVRILVETHVL